MADASAYDPHPRSRRWPWLLLGVVLLVIAVDQCYRLYVHTQVEHELNALRQEGYPVTERELAASIAPVPDPENAALRIMEAADELALPRDAFNDVSWGRTDELGPQERDALQTILTNNASALEMVHAAAQLKQSRYPINYEKGPGALLPHLAKIKSLVQLLKAEAVIQAEEGHLDQAVRAVRDALAISRSLDQEPLLISQLVRMAAVTISCSTTERLLTQYQLTDPQLQDLGAAFAAVTDASAPAFARGFVGEVCLGSYCFTASPREMVAIMDQDGTANQSQAGGLAQVAFPLYAWTGLRDRDFLFYLRMMHGTLSAAKAPFPQSRTMAQEVSARVDARLAKDKLLLFSRMLLPAFQKSIDKSADLQARLRAAGTALDVERYRVAHKALPDELSQLVPGLLPKVPEDPFDGSPLRYRKLNPGYVVYSVGPDGTDEGGTERSSAGGTSVRKWPPGKKNEPGAKPKARSSGSSTIYDVTFTVER